METAQTFVPTTLFDDSSSKSSFSQSISTATTTTTNTFSASFRMSIPRRKGGSISHAPSNILLPTADFSGLTIGSPSPGLTTPGIGANHLGMSSNVSLSGTTVVDIQMGPTTNTLAAKTASMAGPQTMFEMCSETRRRLRRVNGYDRFIELPSGAPKMDVMQHVWQSFRLGTSLCHLFNMLLPNFSYDAPMPISIEFPDFDFEGPEGRGVYAWAREKDNLKKCKKGAANFIMRMTELKKSGRWPEEDPLWSVMELFGEDTGGLKRVLHTVINLLDRLPESAWVQDDVNSPATPYSTTTPHTGDQNGHESFANAPPLPYGHGRHYSESQPMGRSPSSASTLREMPYNMSMSSQFPNTNSGGGMPRQPLSINTSFDGKNFPRSHMSAGPGPMTGMGPGPMDGGAMAVAEILRTEKKYVSDLEVLQAYAQALLQHSIVAPDTVHMMFSNLGKLIDIQRRFLTCLETEFEPMVEKGGSAWLEGNWGYPFALFEKDFEVYEPYCANYMNALELVEKETPNLQRDVLPLTVAELNAYLIIPIQRICRYPILLDALIKGASDKDYPYMAELTSGHEVTKRIAESVNETIRQNSNISIVAELQFRVKDWKGHHISEFGNLLLEGRFVVTKGDLNRDYEVYLFEKMILCCKEILPDKKDKRSGKSGSLLKKQHADKHISGPPKKNPLSLKGRIYVNNLTHLQKGTAEGEYALSVYWRQQENPNEFESFVLHVKNAEQYNQWEAALTKLMAADQKRREMRDKDRHSLGISRRHISAATNFAATPASEGPSTGPLNGSYFERDLGSAGWDDDGGTPSTSASSTPYLSRRTLSQSGVPRPPDRYSNMSARSSNDDPNGLLMAQWRSQQSAAPMPPIPMRNSSEASVATEASFGNPSSLPRSSLGRGGLPTRIARVMSDDSHGPALAATPETYEAGQEILRSSGGETNGSRYTNGAAGARPMHGVYPSASQSPSLRMRSASSSNVYQLPKIGGDGHNPQTSPMHSASPLGIYDSRTVTPHDYGDPAAQYANDGHRGSDPRFKSSNRGSGSTEGSDASSHSPKTPFDGQVPDSAKIASGTFTGSSTDVSHYSKQNVIIKVLSPNAVFTLAVSPDISCEDLKTKVARKVNTCVGGTVTGVLKCYYRDEDDDRLLLNSSDDVQTLFEPFMKGVRREVELEVKQ